MDEVIRQWMDDLQERLDRSNNTLRKEQALLELLVKITNLMRSGNFKEAAFLRSEFDRIKAYNETTEEY